MEKINFEDGQLVSQASVNIEGTIYPVAEAEYESPTPLSAYMLNKMQENIENAIVDTPATQEQNGLMSAEDKTKLDNYSAGITGDTFPIGAVIEWDFETLPNNWLWTDHDYPIEDYPELYALYGTRFNKEDTPEGYFRTSKRAGLVAVGKDENDSDFNELGKTLGSKYLEEHNHTGATGTGETSFMRIIGATGTDHAANHIPGHTSGDYVDTNKGDFPGANHTHNFTTNNTGTGHSGNIQPSIVTNYIVKARQSAGVVAEVIQEDGESNNTNVYSAEAIKKIIEDMILEDNKKKYYIGKIIMDTANVDPVTYLGFGTWQYWGSGRVPVGVDVNDEDFNTVEKVLGSKSTTLGKDNLPTLKYWSGDTDEGELLVDSAVNSGTSIGFKYIKNGASTPINNLQPSITCYMWKRVA